MPPQLSRLRITIEQKRALIKHHESNPSANGRELRAWARSSFGLSREPSKSTMSGWLNSRNDHDVKPSHKAARRPHHPEFEKQLMLWITKCEEWYAPIVSGPTIRAKAVNIRDRLLRDNESGMSSLQSATFSNGWLHRFQMRHNLKSRRVFGEAASASKNAVDVGRNELLQVTRDFEPCNIFNLDETAYFYCTSQSRVICSTSMPGRKKVKKRITVAVTSNADGSCKWPLLFIGMSKQPRCFGSRTADQLDFEYRATKKGWMTGSVFATWVEQFNERMHGEGRRVLLLLDNASPHRYPGELSNVTIKMLPPNTTAFLQPQDAGVIQAFKSKITALRA
ncbi:hypothetical protein LEN26_002536 [Aphanomyces euteiches]|nr:hypothetical protein LEN26_007282 [Aphanomyces euteiches]KAH9134832.1 hypothetical protein LEN26_006703 [Aphanomyces euteiches]KAH9154309.1 hypothetical protein LEN26_003438 [Aphanomyces euteiches]KAH9159042.1 hypothetical protein LEN26_002536 [Aphanomyces euteiches]KAH9168648.1 hypothetical protein AeNC1_017876 [Aphanomyces euteiches]